MSCSVDGILQENFLTKYKAEIGYCYNILKLRSEDTDVCTPINRNFNLFKHKIQACCECIKFLPIKHNGEYVTLTIEIREGVLIAGLITKPQNGQILVTIFNTTDEDLEIF